MLKRINSSIQTSLFFLLISSFLSCASSSTVAKNNTSKASKIISNAYKYKGVKYKFGGTTTKGMDCSGLVYVSFKKEHITLPRMSRNMAKLGKKIKKKHIKKGDLLFFKTSNASKINHVGLVISIKKNQITFIHATKTRGVTTSNLSQKYWKNSFLFAKRIL